jgi:chemotaxis protein histidine kinase CheA
LTTAIDISSSAVDSLTEDTTATTTTTTDKSNVTLAVSALSLAKDLSGKEEHLRKIRAPLPSQFIKSSAESEPPSLVAKAADEEGPNRASGASLSSNHKATATPPSASIKTNNTTMSASKGGGIKGSNANTVNNPTGVPKKKSRNQEMAAAVALAAIKAQQAKNAAAEARRAAEEEMRAAAKAARHGGGKAKKVEKQDAGTSSQSVESSTTSLTSSEASEASKPDTSGTEEDSKPQHEVQKLIPPSTESDTQNGGMAGLAAATSTSETSGKLRVFSRTLPTTSTPAATTNRPAPSTSRNPSQAPPPAYPQDYYPYHHPMDQYHPNCPSCRPPPPPGSYMQHPPPPPHSGTYDYYYMSYAPYDPSHQHPPPPHQQPYPYQRSYSPASGPTAAGPPKQQQQPSKRANGSKENGAIKESEDAPATSEELFSKQSTREYMASVANMPPQPNPMYHYCNDPNCPDNYGASS